jgi:hypothetical protein
MKMLLVPTMILMMSQAFAQDCLERICRGDTIIDRDNDVGVVVGILEGKVVYRIGNSRYESHLQGLGKAIESSTFPVGKVVIDKDNDIGTVDTAFDDARVRYKIGSSFYISNTLSPEVSAIGEIKNGIVVMDKDNDIGVALRAFANQKVQYRIGSSNYVSMAANLGHEVASVGNLKNGIFVIDKDNDIGLVQKTFSHSKVQYRIGSSNYVSQAALLSPETNKVDNLLAGIIVLDKDNDIGAVTRLFENKKIQYKLGSSHYISSSSLLSPEVSTHEKYNKEDLYASGTAVGKVDYFFENGKISLKGLDGYRTVSKELAAEVSSLGNVITGSKLQTSGKYRVVALNLFENNTVYAQKTSIVGNEVINQNKGFSLINNEQMSEIEIANYLLQLYHADNTALSMSGSMAVDEAELSALKEKLSASLKIVEKSFNDKKKLKDLKVYLGLPVEEERAPEVKPEPSKPTPAPIKTNLQLKISDDSLLPVALFELAKLGVVPEVVKELTSTNSLEINATRSKGFPLPKCSISYRHTKKNLGFSMTQSGSKVKSVFASYKNSCNRPLKKLIRSFGHSLK